MSEAFRSEVEEFMRVNPETEKLDVILADMNGIFRGKQLPAKSLDKLADGNFYMPITTPFLTTNGANAEKILDDFGSDPDRRCYPVAGSLKPVPWASRPTAQIQVDMVDKDDAPIFASPRTVLSRVLSELRELGLTPVVAIEYEFFLFKAGSETPEVVDPMNGMPRGADANCYNLDVYADFEPLMTEIEQAAMAQGLDVTGLISEYGNGQFEANLGHVADAMKACDDALLLKRVVRGVAHKHDLLASFMAKPMPDEVGSGLHAHVSLLNNDGLNVFAQDDGEKTLRDALGGLLETMPAATAFFAPNANSYRRFDEEWFAPVVRNWGENNRRLSLRLPMADAANRRFEHRVSGADASPHLVVAAVLAGVCHGLKNELDPGKPLGEFDLVDFDEVLPPRWKMALEVLKKDTVLGRYLGEEFVDLYLRVRESEEEEFHCKYYAADHTQYLRIL